jgi:hypothetical protein
LSAKIRIINSFIRIIRDYSMKLISLNIWGGNAYEGFMNFVREQAPSTDIFCFQETYRSDAGVAQYGNTHLNILADIVTALPDFQMFFRPMEQRVHEHGPIDIPSEIGLAMFIRSPLVVKQEGMLPIYRTPGSWDRKNDFVNFPHILHYATVMVGTAPCLIISVHGTAQPGTKLDTDARIAQSQIIVEFMNNTEGAKILCGDFNLMPETESIAMIERARMRNLIKEFNITDTRGRLSHEKWPNSPQFFADYTFVSPEIKVKNFLVPPVPASDHLPMILEFEI